MVKQKIKVGIIGTGNIGSDLLMKVMRSDVLECGIFAGHSPDSKGIARARELDIPVTYDSIRYIELSSGGIIGSIAPLFFSRGIN